MYKLFCFSVCLSMALQTPVYADDGQITPPKIFHHMMVQTVLDRLIPQIASIKSAKDAEKVFLPLFPKAKDQETLRKTLRKIGVFPSPVRLNRGIGFRQDGRLYTITYTNLYRGQVQFNDKVNWTYQPNNPISIQLESIQRFLEKSEKKSVVMSLILPEVNAAAGWIGVLIAIAGLFMGAAGNSSVQSYYIPLRTARYCIEQEKKAQTLSLEEKFANAKYCEEFEKLKPQLLGTATPSVAALPTNQSSTPIEVKSKCRKEGEDNQISEIKNIEKGITLKITTTFKGDDPVRIISESPNGMVIEYKLQDKKLVSGLTKVGTTEIFASRDPEYLKTLASDKERADELDRMKAYDADLKDMINPILLDCDNKAKATATANADKPASALAQELLSSDSPPRERHTVQGVERSSTSKK